MLLKRLYILSLLFFVFCAQTPLSFVSIFSFFSLVVPVFAFYLVANATVFSSYGCPVCVCLSCFCNTSLLFVHFILVFCHFLSCQIIRIKSAASETSFLTFVIFVYVSVVILAHPIPPLKFCIQKHIIKSYCYETDFVS
jgi:hypothetical protein